MKLYLVKPLKEKRLYLNIQRELELLISVGLTTREELLDPGYMHVDGFDEQGRPYIILKEKK